MTSSNEEEDTVRVVDSAHVADLPRRGAPRNAARQDCDSEYEEEEGEEAESVDDSDSEYEEEGEETESEEEESEEEEGEEQQEDDDEDEEEDSEDDTPKSRFTEGELKALKEAGLLVNFSIGDMKSTIQKLSWLACAMNRATNTLLQPINPNKDILLTAFRLVESADDATPLSAEQLDFLIEAALSFARELCGAEKLKSSLVDFFVPIISLNGGVLKTIYQHFETASALCFLVHMAEDIDHYVPQCSAQHHNMAQVLRTPLDTARADGRSLRMQLEELDPFEILYQLFVNLKNFMPSRPALAALRALGPPAQCSQIRYSLYDTRKAFAKGAAGIGCKMGYMTVQMVLVAHERDHNNQCPVATVVQQRGGTRDWEQFPHVPSGEVHSRNAIMRAPSGFTPKVFPVADRNTASMEAGRYIFNALNVTGPAHGSHFKAILREVLSNSRLGVSGVAIFVRHSQGGAFKWLKIGKKAPRMKYSFLAKRHPFDAVYLSKDELADMISLEANNFNKWKLFIDLLFPPWITRPGLIRLYVEAVDYQVTRDDNFFRYADFPFPDSWPRAGIPFTENAYMLSTGERTRAATYAAAHTTADTNKRAREAVAPGGVDYCEAEKRFTACARV